MNASGYNTNGWEASDMRKNLNSITAVDGMTNLSNIESVIGNDIIKSVMKNYIKTYNNAGSITTCNDKLWLLACSEIWNNGYNGTGTYGYAKASEGAQYKYYADINATYNSGNSKLYKMYQGSTSSSYWWLRSAESDYDSCASRVYSDGNIEYHNVSIGFHSQWIGNLFYCIFICLLCSFSEGEAARADPKSNFRFSSKEKGRCFS